MRYQLCSQLCKCPRRYLNPRPLPYQGNYALLKSIAMNDFYTERWSKVRGIEGASQRIQEDTMRFSGIMQGLGVAMIDSIMTLISFLPVLLALSIHVENVPIIGAVPYPLVSLAIFWSIFGTFVLIFAGIKLPGLDF